MSAELEMVTDFASLKAGDRIVDLNCSVCERPMCEGTLTTFDATTWTIPVWVAGDPCREGRRVGITPFSVAQRRIFRRVTRPGPTARAAAAPKTLERVR